MRPETNFNSSNVVFKPIAKNKYIPTDIGVKSQASQKPSFNSEPILKRSDCYSIHLL
jgi:hypothetical protein